MTIQNYTPEILAMWTAIAADLDAIDTEEACADDLNESYDFSRVGGPFAGMLASDVLKNCDEVAWRERLNNHIDGMCRDDAWVEIDGEYYDRRDVEKAVEDYIDGLPEETPDNLRETLEKAVENL